MGTEGEGGESVPGLRNIDGPFALTARRGSGSAFWGGRGNGRRPTESESSTVSSTRPPQSPTVAGRYARELLLPGTVDEDGEQVSGVGRKGRGWKKREVMFTDLSTTRARESQL